MNRSRELNESELKQRIVWFNEWIKTIDERINNWKETLPLQLSAKLDKSPESLILLGEYLVETFHDANSANDPELEFTMDAIATYIGEVYRLNLPGKQLWKPSPEVMDSAHPKFYFYCEVGLDFNRGGKNPFSKVRFVIYNKSPLELFEYFQMLVKSTEEAIRNEEKRRNQIPIPGRGGYSYQYFILLSNESYGLTDLEKRLKSFYSAKSKSPEVYLANEARLVVEMSKEFCFHFWYDDRSSVLDESKEIAESYTGNKKAIELISSCKYRIEFWGDSDPGGEYFNEHLFILDEIVKIEGVFVFNIRQGVFYDEM